MSKYMTNCYRIHFKSNDKYTVYEKDEYEKFIKENPNLKEGVDYTCEYCEECFYHPKVGKRIEGYFPPALFNN